MKDERRASFTYIWSKHNKSYSIDMLYVIKESLKYNKTQNQK